MLTTEHFARQLIEDRHKELRRRTRPQPRPPSPPRRWQRPGRR